MKGTNGRGSEKKERRRNGGTEYVQHILYACENVLTQPSTMESECMLTRPVPRLHHTRLAIHIYVHSTEGEEISMHLGCRYKWGMNIRAHHGMRLSRK